MKKHILPILVILLSQLTDLRAMTISVYHTSDVHGWYSARPATWDKENSTRTIGGFAALSAYIKTQKKPYILLDSGDMFQGTPEGNFTKGMATVQLMNKLGYSAALAGNHDYDFGEANLKTLISSSTFQWLGANVYVKETGKAADYLKPYVILEKAGKKIAVLGLAGKHTSTSTLPLNVKHLQFRDEDEEAAKWMKEIKQLNPDAVIIIAHTGITGNYAGKVDISTLTLTGADARQGTLAIARSADGAQVVLGGHNHFGIAAGYFDKKSSTLLGESYWGLTDISKVDLEFDDATGKFKGATDRLIPLWVDTTGEDTRITEIINGFSAEVNQEMAKTVGKSNSDLGISETGLDSPIGNWMTDAMRRQTGTDIAFQNTAGIRSDIKKGTVTMRDIYQVMPFENTIVTLKLTGAQLHKLIGANFKNGKTRLQISGLVVKFKLSPEDKIETLVIERGGKPIRTSDEFTVVTNNYLTTGGTGGQVLAEGKDLHDTMQTIRDLLIKEVEERSPLEMPEGNRFIRLD